ncbi:MAG: hypothetical protein Q3996_03275 [Candidatus Saccharibacteria bacterium]|nr:hypothetical protein [Candidatus Saccharibacteria bacterium]
MNDFLRENIETVDNQPNLDPEVTKIAINGLSRLEDNRDIANNNSSDTTNIIDKHPDELSDDCHNNEDCYNDDDEKYDEDEENEYDYFDEYEEYHYGEERVDYDEKKLTLQEIAIPKEIIERYSFLSELPQGIAVMGGVARSIAREIITGDREPIRDIDLVNIIDDNGNSKVDDETLDKLSLRFMPDDYSFGHGIGNDTLGNYFKTRDFTINQSLILDGKLIVSDFAYNDFQENIIRPTYFEHPYDGDNIKSRLFLKALMMRGIISQISDSVPLIEDIERPDYIGNFDVALFLNKAMSRGAQTAAIFTEGLAD